MAVTDALCVGQLGGHALFGYGSASEQACADCVLQVLQDFGDSAITSCAGAVRAMLHKV